MRDLLLGIIFILWMFITAILMVSIVGWILLVKPNYTTHHKTGEEARTVWVQFGYDLKEYFINKN